MRFAPRVPRLPYLDRCRLPVLLPGNTPDTWRIAAHVLDIPVRIGVRSVQQPPRERSLIYSENCHTKACFRHRRNCATGGSGTAFAVSGFGWIGFCGTMGKRRSFERSSSPARSGSQRCISPPPPPWKYSILTGRVYLARRIGSFMVGRRLSHDRHYR